MSECEICGREDARQNETADKGLQCWPDMRWKDPECYRLGYEREKARAEAEYNRGWNAAYGPVAAEREAELLSRLDRSEAEFCACKALLGEAQRRAERAEAERAEARAALDLAQKALRRAQSVGFNEGEPYSSQEKLAGETADLCGEALRALAALPVEPARRQVTDNANALGAPAARSPTMPEEES